MDLKIFAYKHNGSFHRLWTKSQLMEETKDYYVSRTESKVKVIESNGRFWFTRETAISYFSKNRWFNIIVIYKKDEIVYYCNLASPIIKELNSLKYIDYDLDLKYYSNTKDIKILDRGEFNVNKNKYSYPKWIEDKVELELKTLQSWAKNEIGPFSEEFRMKWKINN